MARTGNTRPKPGYYGVVEIGDGWKPVTSESSAHTLALDTAIEAGATHVAYWNGFKWEHVDPVEDV